MAKISDEQKKKNTANFNAWRQQNSVLSPNYIQLGAQKEESPATGLAAALQQAAQVAEAQKQAKAQQVIANAVQNRNTVPENNNILDALAHAGKSGWNNITHDATSNLLNIGEKATDFIGADKANESLADLLQRTAADKAEDQAKINAQYGQFGGLAGTVNEVGTNAVSMAPQMAAFVLNPFKKIQTAGKVGGWLLKNLPSTAVMVNNSMGAGINKALNEGAELEDAQDYGALNAGKEVIPELMFGGVKYLPGAVKVGKMAADAVTNPIAKKVAGATANMASEGAEEAISEIIDPFIQRATYNENAQLDWNEVIHSAMIGALTTGAINATGTAVEKGVNALPNAEKVQQNDQNRAFEALHGQKMGQNQTINAQNAQNGAGQVQATDMTNPIRTPNKVAQNQSSQAVFEQNAVKNVQNQKNNDITPKLEDARPKITLEMKDRTFENVADKNVLAYQQEHPEIKPFQQETAVKLLYDLQMGKKGRREVGIDAETRNVTTMHGIKRNQSEPINRMLNDGLSYSKIEDGLNRIIEDEGSENTPNAKRVELYVHDAMRDGYNSIVDGRVSGNRNYAISNMSMEELEAETQRLTAELSAVTDEEQFAQIESQLDAIDKRMNLLKKDITPKLERAAQPEPTIAENTTVSEESSTVEPDSINNYAEFARERLKPEVREFIGTVGQKLNADVIVMDGLPKGANGMFTDGKVYLNGKNINSIESVRAVTAHEVYHAMKNTDEFRNLQDVAMEFYRTLNPRLTNDDWVQMKIKEYGDKGVPLSVDAAYDELTADFMEVALFDAKVAERIWTEHPTLAQRIKWFIDDLLFEFRNRKLSDLEYKQAALLYNAQQMYAEGLQSMKYRGQDSGDTRYMFAGENSLTADREALARAKQMEAEGTDMEAIRQATGWFKSKVTGGKWAYEIDDSKADYTFMGDLNRLKNDPEYAEYMQMENNLSSLDFDANPELEKRYEYLFRKYAGTSRSKSAGSDVRYSLSKDTSGRQLTAEQAEYFKNSKVRDDNGNLIVMYHGTEYGGFTEFAHNKTYDKKSFFFTDSPVVARTYSGNDKFYNPAKHSDELVGQVNYEVYLDIQNPYVIDAKGARSHKLPPIEQYQGKNQNKGLITTEDYADYAYNNGYDGVIFKNMIDTAYFASSPEERNKQSTVAIAFYPEQIKDVENKKPTLNEDIRYSFSSGNHKERQFAVIQNSNPMQDDYHTGIRSTSDILTFEEAIQEDTFTPDYTEQDAKNALRKGKITVYSSYPISQGVFVTPSKMEAQNYAGNGKVYSKTVSLEDVAWIDSMQGQYAKVEGESRYSMGNSRYQEMLDRYGSIEPGENPTGNNRDVKVPKQTSDFDKTRKFTRTAMEAEQVDDVTTGMIADDLTADMQSGRFIYEPTSNQKQVDRANSLINQTGWEEQAANFRAKYRSGESMSADDIALGERLIQEAQKAGDYQMAVDLIADVAAIGTEAGRSVQALKILKRLTPEGQLMALKRIEQRINSSLAAQQKPPVALPESIAEEMLQARGSEKQAEIWDKAIKELANQVPATFADKVNAWRYLAMLSNPKTHIRNMVGNATMRAVMGVKNVVQTGIETTLSPFGIERTAAIKVPKEYRDFAKWDFENNAKKMLEAGGGRYNDEIGLVSQNKQIFKNPVLETARKKNTELLEAEDMLFKKAAYIDAMARYMKANGLSPSVLQNKSAGNNATYEKAQNYAVEQARKATFQEASKLAQKLSEIENMSATGKVMVGALVPFKKTPINILKRGVEYSPVGIINGVKKAMFDVKKGEATPAEVIEAMSAGLTGTGIMMVGYFLASMGLLSAGADDDDQRKARYDSQMGNQNYALVLPDGSTYTIDWLAPSVMPMMVGAELYKQLSGEQADSNNSTGFTKAMEALTRVGNPLLEMSMLQGLTDALQSYNSGTGQFLSDFAISAGTGYAGQFIPAPVSAMARTLDDTVRSSYAPKDSPLMKEGESFLRQQANKLPVVSQQMQPSIDLWGNERKREGDTIAERAFHNFINPGTYSSNKRTALDNKLDKLYEATGDSNVLPKTAASYIDVGDKTIYMTALEYAQFSTTKGQKSKEYVTDFINSSAYRMLDDTTKAGIVNDLYKLANYQAEKQILSGRRMSNPNENYEKVLKSGVAPGKYYATKEALSDFTGDGSKDKKIAYLQKMKNSGEITDKQFWYMRRACIGTFNKAEMAACPYADIKNM